MVLTPDELQAKIYREDIEPNIKEGATLAFGHGKQTSLGNKLFFAAVLLNSLKWVSKH